MTGRKVPWVGQGPGSRFVQAARSWVAAPHSWSRAEPEGRNSGGSYRQASSLRPTEHGEWREGGDQGG